MMYDFKSLCELKIYNVRLTGIEPVLPPWKGGILPLNYKRFETVICPLIS